MYMHKHPNPKRLSVDTNVFCAGIELANDCSATAPPALGS